MTLRACVPGCGAWTLGCGGGAVSLELAELTGAAGSVVGVDMDRAKLELAPPGRTRARPGQCRLRGGRCQCLGCAGRL